MVEQAPEDLDEVGSKQKSVGPGRNDLRHGRVGEVADVEPRGHQGSCQILSAHCLVVQKSGIKFSLSTFGCDNSTKPDRFKQK